jgi:hypothetical protein
MYNKLFTKILDSSIWLEDHATVRVWVTLMAVMDQDGMCHFASVANLARRANVSTEEATAAVNVLEGPDPHSSDPDNDGRRIERVPGGWIVLNSRKYRAIVSANESRRLTAERSKRYRDRKKNNVTSVTKRDEVAERHAAVTQAEAEAEAVFLKGTTLEDAGQKATPPLFPDGRPDYGFDFTKESPSKPPARQKRKQKTNWHY